MGRLAEELK